MFITWFPRALLSSLFSNYNSNDKNNNNNNDTYRLWLTSTISFSLTQWRITYWINEAHLWVCLWEYFPRQLTEDGRPTQNVVGTFLSQRLVSEWIKGERLSVFVPLSGAWQLTQCEQPPHTPTFMTDHHDGLCPLKLWAKIKSSFLKLLLLGILSQQWAKKLMYYFHYIHCSAPGIMSYFRCTS